jgi:glucokinase
LGHIHKDVFDQAEEGDPTAHRLIDDAANYLGVLAINVARVVDPQMVIMTGGMALAGTLCCALIH